VIYLSGASGKYFANVPADATATPSSLASLNVRMVCLSGADLPRWSYKKVVKRMLLSFAVLVLDASRLPLLIGLRCSTCSGKISTSLFIPAMSSPAVSALCCFTYQLLFLEVAAV